MLSNSSSFINDTRKQISSFGPKGDLLLECVDRGDYLIRMRRVMWIDGKPHCTCKEGDRCPGPGKHPRDLVSKPLDPADPRTLRVILVTLKIDSSTGFGIHLGLSHKVALDVDTKNDGLANWARLQNERGLSHLVPYTMSGSGGPHYIFDAPANCDERRGWTGPNGETSCSVKIAGVGDFKSGQGFVVLPYSAHRSGGIYTRAGGPLYAEMPAAMVDFVNSQNKFTDVRVAIPVPPIGGYRRAAVGGWTDLDRAIAYLEKVPGAISNHGGHDVTYHVACELMKEFVLPFDDAMVAFQIWNQKCDPPWSVNDLARKLQQADASPGPRGGKRDAEYERPLSAEEQWLRDVVCRIRWGNVILITGPNNTLAGKEYAPGHDPRDLDLNDLAAAAGVADASPAGPSSPTPGQADIRLYSLPEPSTTAADDGWPEDPPRVECQSCPHAVPVVMVNRETKKGAIFRFPCRKLSCPWCGPVKRDHWKATVRHHVAELVRRRRDLDTEPVYLFRCRRGAWLRVSAFIRASGGDFFRLDYQASAAGPGDAYMVLSTVRPHGAEVTPYTPEAARDRFCDAIEALSCFARGRLFASSHDWKLLPDGEPAEKKWEKVCRITTAELTSEKILAEHGCEWRYARGSARWWAWQATVFSIAGVDFSALVEDLDLGARLSGRRFGWGRSEAPPDTKDESPPTSATYPPASTFVLDLQ